jgi:hypothetical protein
MSQPAGCVAYGRDGVTKRSSGKRWAHCRDGSEPCQLTSTSAGRRAGFRTCQVPLEQGFQATWDAVHYQSGSAVNRRSGVFRWTDSPPQIGGNRVSDAGRIDHARSRTNTDPASLRYIYMLRLIHARGRKWLGRCHDQSDGLSQRTSTSAGRHLPCYLPSSSGSRPSSHFCSRWFIGWFRLEIGTAPRPWRPQLPKQAQ